MTLSFERLACPFRWLPQLEPGQAIAWVDVRIQVYPSYLAVLDNSYYAHPIYFYWLEGSPSRIITQRHRLSFYQNRCYPPAGSRPTGVYCWSSNEFIHLSGMASLAAAVDPAYDADVPLNALRVVQLSSTGRLELAGSDRPDEVFRIVGLLPSAIAPGEPIAPVSSGTLSDSSWSWLPGQPIFLGLQGQLSQSPPASGFILQVATAVTPNLIRVEIQEPIFL